ncbi:MAG: enoyl-CoA hydratase/isomerase family protein [Gammaproteobacteria bacterium]|nr:enoyl-CoA hydratase/isomerase family protein [Gammaproteobacteria bacterium]
MTELITLDAYLEQLQSPHLGESFSSILDKPYIVVEASNDLTLDPGIIDPLLPNCPVIGLGDQTVDTIVDLYARDETTLHQILSTISKQPLACTLLVQLLRHNVRSSVADGLLAESLAYSALQHSTGFQTWLSQRGHLESKPDTHSPLVVDRFNNTLVLTLNRPHVHNAYNEALKDALCEALQIALIDPQISSLLMKGNGDSFCAGGDLTEFGTAQDAALAHLSRMARSAGALLSNSNCHTTAELHGACIGAGIEIPAFANHISAKTNTYFVLPEIAMGLVPGAGGTVSIPARIGRHRTAFMAITSQRIGVETALDWGLIDEIL